jgi:hypothetical protein
MFIFLGLFLCILLGFFGLFFCVSLLISFNTRRQAKNKWPAALISLAVAMLVSGYFIYGDQNEIKRQPTKLSSIRCVRSRGLESSPGFQIRRGFNFYRFYSTTNSTNQAKLSFAPVVVYSNVDSQKLDILKDNKGKAGV